MLFSHGNSIAGNGHAIPRVTLNQRFTRGRQVHKVPDRPADLRSSERCMSRSDPAQRPVLPLALLVKKYSTTYRQVAPRFHGRFPLLDCQQPPPVAWLDGTKSTLSRTLASRGVMR